MGKKESAEETIKTIRRHTHRQYSAEEKIRIVIAGMRGEVHNLHRICVKTQPFTAPDVRPATICFWKKIYMISGGIVMMITSALRIPAENQ